MDVDIADVGLVDHYLSVVAVIIPHHQLDDGALSTSGFTYDSVDFLGKEGQCYPFEDAFLFEFIIVG